MPQPDARIESFKVTIDTNGLTSMVGARNLNAREIGELMAEQLAAHDIDAVEIARAFSQRVALLAERGPRPRR